MVIFFWKWYAVKVSSTVLVLGFRTCIDSRSTSRQQEEGCMIPDLKSTVILHLSRGLCAFSTDSQSKSLADWVQCGGHGYSWASVVKI